MNGHHANVRALSGTVEDLNLSRLDIHPLDGFAGKRGARGTNVKDQPPAVRRPGARVGKLMMTGSKGDLFHKHTLMRDFRIRVSYRKELAYSFDIPHQQDVRERAYQRNNGNINQRRGKTIILGQIAHHQRVR